MLAAGPFLVGCGSSVASAPTTLRGVFAATVVHVDGRTVPAVNGLRLQADDVVRTGTGGRAELVTRDRVVYVGPQAAVQVTNGERQVLRHGAVVADAKRGPGLHIEAAGVDVNADSGSAVRVERSVITRVGALVGDAAVTSSAGRSVDVTALHQIMVSGDALPDAATPLRLTDDDGEAHAVPDLVRDDRTLIGLARGIDSTGHSTENVVAAAFYRPLTAPSGVGRSERVLPAVIAAAGSNDGLRSRYDDAVRYRKAGGSWAVVTRLVGVSANGVVDALAKFEATQPPGQIGSVAEILAAAGSGTGGAHAGSGNSSSNSTDNNDGNNGPGDGGSPSPSPSPTPSGPVDQVVDTVQDVLKIIPTPGPSASLPLPEVTSLPQLPTGH